MNATTRNSSKGQSALLDNAVSMFGPLSPEYRAKINAFLDSPSFETWDQCSGIIVAKGGFGLTVWQAVARIAPQFRKITKPYPWTPGKPTPPAIERWTTFPDPFTVARAIREATSKAA